MQTTKQQYKSSSNEAMPTLRSVSMLSAAPPPPPQFPSSSLRRRCASMMAKNQQQAPRTAVVAATTTTTTKKNTMASLSRDDLVDVQSVVPAGLRRHALATGLPLQVALERISTFLRLQSIPFVEKSSREEEETGGVLECKATAAPDVHFRIYLWKRSSEDDSVVIKLERVRGCGVLVQQMRRSFYRALLKASSAAPSVVPIIATTEGSPRKRRKCPTSLANNNKIDDDEPGAVTRCIALLESTSVDQQRLGMEGLVFLTDVTVVSETCAVKTAERIVQQSSSGLQRQLLTHILRKGEEDTTMKTLALRSLANALEVLTESKSQQQQQLLNESSDFGRTVIKTCISNIQNASLQPQCAALSAKCLALLSVKADDDDDLPIFLTAAETYGKEHHSLLEREAHGLLAQLRV